MAQYCVPPESHCIALPDAIAPVTAAVIANPGMSSFAALRERAQFKPGNRVQLADVQTARTHGARTHGEVGRTVFTIA